MSCTITLKEKGLKLTPQRRLILEIIHDSEGHLTAEEIIEYVQTRVPGVNKSTIYRTLELLEGLDCVFRSEISGRHVYHHAEEGHHHHAVCRSCGKTIDCDEDLFSSIERTLESKFGFHADLHHMVIPGLCRNCQQKVQPAK